MDTKINKMKDKIHICSWLLTRKCNLKCSYCGISREPKLTVSYPQLNEYFQNQMDYKDVIAGLYNMKQHNPNMFHIFYGGEPLLFPNLHKVINFCNDVNIHYTIITNNTDEIQPLLTKLFNNVEYVSGLTSSVDPLLYDPKRLNDDRAKKTHFGFKRLIELKSKIKDLVAEITVSNDNIDYLYPLVKDLTNEGISSDITFVDIAKNPYYDFSNVTDKDQLVYPSIKLEDILQKIYSDKLNVHLDIHFMKKVYESLPAELDCKLEDGIHNITIDADGTVRLCLRIRGIETPNNYRLSNIFKTDYTVDPILRLYQSIDKIKYCERCNWTCIIMSEMLKNNKINSDELVHQTVRKGEIK
jgi:MoaA/NifB/PqqE/SkfB family radical SAM enzyme